MFGDIEQMVLQEFVQRFNGASFPKIRVTSPVNELQCLNKKFYFTDSARPQFDMRGLFLLGT